MTRGWTSHRPTFFIRALRPHPVHHTPPLAPPPRPSPTDSRFHVLRENGACPATRKIAQDYLPWNDTIKLGVADRTPPVRPPWTSKLIFFSPLYFWPSMSRPSCVVYRCTVRSLLMTRSPCNEPFQLVNLGQCVHVGTLSASAAAVRACVMILLYDMLLARASLAAIQPLAAHRLNLSRHLPICRHYALAAP